MTLTKHSPALHFLSYGRIRIRFENRINASPFRRKKVIIHSLEGVEDSGVLDDVGKSPMQRTCVFLRHTTPTLNCTSSRKTSGRLTPLPSSVDRFVYRRKVAVAAYDSTHPGLLENPSGVGTYIAEPKEPSGACENEDGWNLSSSRSSNATGDRPSSP